MKIFKKDLVRKVYSQLLADKADGFLGLQFNADGTMDTNRFIRKAKQEILINHNIDVKSETVAVYLREFKRLKKTG